MTVKSPKTSSFLPLVSCIIPVYNAEKYLNEGIQSLLAQTYSNIEIILVDDYSKDDSWNICLKYAEEYSNVFAYKNKENSGGPLRGRERGIKESRGEWLTFMDCDDYVTPTYIEHLIEATHEGKYDIAVTGHSRLHTDGRVEDFIWNDYSQTTDERLAVFYDHFLKGDYWTDPTDTVGQNLIRAEVCKRTDLSKYSNLVYAEDTLMALAFLVHSHNGVNFTDKHDFVWRQVEGSGSHGGFSSRADKPEFINACYDLFHDPKVYSRITKALPLASIIIPVYNVEEYLSDCLKSVVGQTYDNIEVIVVNDGSPDSSQKIIDEYEKKDTRIRSIKQTNQGLNMARATGSKAAKGDLVAYVDSDDFVDQNYIRAMYENMIVNDVDISICGLIETAGGVTPVNKVITPNYHQQVLKEGRDIMCYFLGSIPTIPNVHPMTAWGKLYKAAIIKSTDWKMSNYRRHEDNFELLQWYSKASKGISVISDQLYYYRKNPNSITQKLSKNINPDNREINYFEYMDELYEKTKDYLDDESLEIDLLKNFSRVHIEQLERYYINKQLDDDSMRSLVANLTKAASLYELQIESRNDTILRQQEYINQIHNSRSWKLIRHPKRAVALYRKIRRK